MCDLEKLDTPKPVMKLCDWVRSAKQEEKVQHWANMIEGTEVQVDLTAAEKAIKEKSDVVSVTVAKVPLEAVRDGEKARPKEKSKEKGAAETKLNKYGFIHIPKELVKTLPFMAETKLNLRVTKTQLIIEKAK